MILILKTNDLLRGLDARLKTKTASASFITMSKCCLRALYKDERSKCTTFGAKVVLDFRYYYDMSRMFVFQAMNSPLARLLRDFRASLMENTSRFLVLIHIL